MTSTTCSTPNRKSVSFENNEQRRSGARGATPTSTTNIYTAFDDLANCYEDNSNFGAIISELKEQIESEDNWRIHFAAVETLRVLNKYYPNEIRKYFADLVTFLQKSLESLRSNLSKNTLMLIREVFQSYKHSQALDSFLNEILPIILEKSVSEHSFLKSEARAALKALEKTGCNNNVIQVHCSKSFDKNGVISELSFQSLTDIIQQAKENLTKDISHDILETLFHTVAQSLDGKRAVNKRVAKGLCEQLKRLFSEGGKDFDGYMRENLKLKETEIQIINESMKKSTHNTRAVFSCFIKTKKLKQEVDKNSNPANFTLVSINLKK